MAWRNPHRFSAGRGPGQPSAVWRGPCQTIAAQIPPELPPLGAAHTFLRLGAAPANYLLLGLVRPGVLTGPSWPGAAHTSLRLGTTPANHLRPGVASAKLLRPGVPFGLSLSGAAHVSRGLVAALAKLLRPGVPAKTSWPDAGHTSLRRSNIHSWARPNPFMWLGAALTNHLRPGAVLLVLFCP